VKVAAATPRRSLRRDRRRRSATGTFTPTGPCIGTGRKTGTSTATTRTSLTVSRATARPTFTMTARCIGMGRTTRTTTPTARTILSRRGWPHHRERHGSLRQVEGEEPSAARVTPHGRLEVRAVGQTFQACADHPPTVRWRGANHWVAPGRLKEHHLVWLRDRRSGQPFAERSSMARQLMTAPIFRVRRVRR
jgi:hypothetical protein